MRKNRLRRKVRGVLESSGQAEQLCLGTAKTPRPSKAVKNEKNEKNLKNPHFLKVPSQENFLFENQIKNRQRRWHQ